MAIRSRVVGTAFYLTAVFWCLTAMFTAAPVAAILDEGCRHEVEVDLPADGLVSVMLTFRPTQRVNLAFIDPETERIYAEFQLVTSRDGALERLFRAEEILRGGGRLAAITTTSDSCDPGQDRFQFEVVGVVAPSPTDDARSSGGPPVAVLVLSALVAAFGFLAARAVLGRGPD
jgi:hypothetical protein